MTRQDGPELAAQSGSSAHSTALIADPDDNVAVALRRLEGGERPVIAGGRPVPPLSEAIPLGHKFALVPIGLGEPVTKFGRTIGYATRPIPEGAHVHLHNIEGASSRARRSSGAR